MKFALAGNPNSGKTTLFNSLTGATAKVGNWPGVTVDRKEGIYKKLGEPVSVLDLPGIYSLSPYTPEEIIAREYLLDETPDVIINIVDATNIERNLYLTTQLIETDIPMVIALNMMDVLDREGTRVEAAVIEQRFGIPVIPISALSGYGVSELMEQAMSVAGEQREGRSVLHHSFMEKEFYQLADILRSRNIKHPVFKAVKLLENDKLEVESMPEDIVKQADAVRAGIKLDEEYDNSFDAAVADTRYKYIGTNLSQAIFYAKSRDDLTKSDRIDKVLTSRTLGLPIFLFLMFLVFHFTFSESFLGFEDVPSPGVWLQGQTETVMEVITESVNGFLEEQQASEWATGLVIDGVLAGVGAVLSFLPQILMLFLFLSIMEDSGYMARAAFLMDSAFRRFGLSGKAFIPLLMGFGCSVPAMMGTKVLDNVKEQRLVIMLMPFFSCGAKMPIWAMIAAAVFPRNADLVVFGIYIGGIIVAAIAAIILNKTVLKGEAAPFIIELPAYHMPQFMSLMLNLWQKLKGFVLRASTIIAGSTVIIWFLSNFNFAFEMVEANSAESILGVLGSAVIPLFAPLGFAGGEGAWKAVVAILTGLIAKEMVISTMGVLYNPDVEGDALEDEEAEEALSAALGDIFTPVAALSFMMFNLLTVPCMAAVATANAELRSFKWMSFTIAFWMGAAWLVSFLVYHIGSLFV